MNGEGRTATANGEGNLVIGYDENSGTTRKAPGAQTGSHNLVLGEEQEFRSYGGIVGGFENTITEPFDAVIGGEDNTASGDCGSVVLTGVGNTASGSCSSVTGGFSNTASGPYAAVSAGEVNTAAGRGASVSGGRKAPRAAVRQPQAAVMKIRPATFRRP